MQKKRAGLYGLARFFVTLLVLYVRYFSFFEGKKNISGERIREARLKLRLSQSDLAARVQVEGVTMERDSISRIEIGTRFIPDYEIPVFARVLGVSALWLLGIE